MWPIPVSANESCSAGTLRVVAAGKPYAVLVVKVSFRWTPERSLALAAPLPLLARDDDANGYPADIAPRLAAPEIVVRASAHQPGPPAPTSTAAVSLYRGDAPLFSKVLHVHGDRRRERPDEVRSFAEMPIVWERARADAHANPVGVPIDADHLPNLVDARRPTAPAGFGAVPHKWPVRDALRGNVVGALARSLEPTLPADFAYKYFQAAPSDQWLPQLAGDEWLVLDGLTKDARRVASQLPGWRALGRAHVDGAVETVALVADRLWVDVQAGVVSLTFRGHVAHRERLVFTTTVERADVLRAWPAVPEPPARAIPVWARSELGGMKPDRETLPLDTVGHESAKDRALAPFDVAGPKEGVRAAVPGAPWAGPSAAPVVKVEPASPRATRTRSLHSADLEPPAPSPIAEPKIETIGERLARAPVAASPAAPPPAPSVAPSTGNESEPPERAARAQNTPARRPPPAPLPSPTRRREADLSTREGLKKHLDRIQRTGGG